MKLTMLEVQLTVDAVVFPQNMGEIIMIFIFLQWLYLPLLHTMVK